MLWVLKRIVSQWYDSFVHPNKCWNLWMRFVFPFYAKNLVNVHNWLFVTPACGKFPFISQCFHQFIYLSGFASVHLPGFASVHLSGFASVHLPGFASVHLSGFAWVHLSGFWSVHLSGFLSVHLSGYRKCSGSVVECLTWDRGAPGLSLTGVTALWSLSKTFILA